VVSTSTRISTTLFTCSVEMGQFFSLLSLRTMSMAEGEHQASRREGCMLGVSWEAGR
jgi:hypothetical protein